MLGAVIGDIVGSPYEFDCNNIKTTDFELISKYSHFTDDTVMTLAVAEAIMRAMPSKGDKITEKIFEDEVISAMQKFGRLYPDSGYGANFYYWLKSENPKPYNSYGNGSAMRVSPVAWAFNNLEDVERFAAASARVSHDHPEGIKGAQAVAGAIFLARNGYDKNYIKNYIETRYNYELNRTLDEIRPNYHHVESCQETVPEALIAFLEADNFEDAVRKAVSLGGDSDTLTAITASIAEGMWGIPKNIAVSAMLKLDEFLISVISRWEKWRG